MRGPSFSGSSSRGRLTCLEQDLASRTSPEGSGLLLGGIGAFAVRWLPAAPKAASAILALQLLMAAIPLITIATLEW